MNNLFFDKDPQIFWTKYLCPVCQEPTGPKSRCHEFDITNQVPPYARNMASLGIAPQPLPLFGMNCVYKMDNLWDAEINYPVSVPLIEQLNTVKGINRIIPIKSYGFRISISTAFEERDVKRDVNIAYKAFIKSMQSHELSKQHIQDNLNYIRGIELPNGEKYLIDTSLPDDHKLGQIKYIQSLYDSISGSKLITDE